jgi:hypothetical protein
MKSLSAAFRALLSHHLARSMPTANAPAAPIDSTTMYTMVQIFMPWWIRQQQHCLGGHIAPETAETTAAETASGSRSEL